MKRLLIVLIFTTVLFQLSAVSQIRISVKDTTVLRGSTFLYAVTVDSSLSGLNVTSYELEINFDPNALRVESVISSGTLTSSWGSPTFNIAGGRINIAAAGTEPLANTGTLVYLRISASIGLPYGASGITFTKAMLNEGTPSTVTRNGTIYIQSLPVITVNPDVVILTVGDTQQFSVSGGVPPFVWSTTNSSIATIDSNGLLRTVGYGFCKVVARDQNSTIDTSGQVEVRSFKLTIRDTTFIQGRSFLMPVYVSDLSNVNVISGQFSVTFDQNIVTITDATTSGTLLQPYGQPTFQVNSGKISVSFAGTTRLDGLGTQILVYLNCKASALNTGGTGLNISELMFNEDLFGNIKNGSVTVQNRSILSVTPATATLVAGDTIRFNAIGTINPPVVWRVSDTTKADISNTGLFLAKKSGTIKVSVEDSVGAIGTSGDITLYDIRVSIKNDSAGIGGWAYVGINIERYIVGISSAQFKLSYDPTYLQPLGVVTTGTLSDGWSASGFSSNSGIYSVAAAGSNSVAEAGTLIKVIFKVSPTTPFGTYAVNISDVVFNEGTPLSLNFNGAVVVDARADVGDDDGLPTTFKLEQNYPNPFNPSTVISWQSPVSGWTTLKVYDVLGREVATLVDEYKQAGKHQVGFQSAACPTDNVGRVGSGQKAVGSRQYSEGGGQKAVSNGVYYYRLVAGDYVAVKKFVLMK